MAVFRQPLCSLIATINLNSMDLAQLISSLLKVTSFLIISFLLGPNLAGAIDRESKEKILRESLPSPNLDALYTDPGVQSLKWGGESNGVVYSLYQNMTNGKSVKAKLIATTDEGGPIITYVIALGGLYTLIRDSRKDEWSYEPKVLEVRSKRISLEVRTTKGLEPLDKRDPLTLPKDEKLKICLDSQADLGKNYKNGKWCFP
jgi:Domain of unknown function (DUF4362)